MTQQVLQEMTPCWVRHLCKIPICLEIDALCSIGDSRRDWKYIREDKVPIFLANRDELLRPLNSLLYTDIASAGNYHNSTPPPQGA